MISIVNNMKKHIANTKIDYVSVVIPISYMVEKKLSESMTLFAHGKKLKWINGKEHFKKGLVYEQKDQGWWLKIQCLPYKSHEHKSRISFNYINAEGLQSIAMLIDKLLPGGYQLALEKGHITRMDFAVDFKGVRPSDFLWGVSHGYKKCQKIVNDNTGQLETVYIGSMKSAKYVVIYDRNAAKKIPCKESNVTTCSIPEYDVTRVEVRLQPDTCIPFNQVHKLTTALDTVHVLMASNSEKSIQTSLELLMRVGDQRFLLNNIAMTKEFLPAHVCESYGTHLKQNSIGKLCNNLYTPVAELLGAHSLAA